MEGLVIVDAANVIGSVPDGWWRDRAGAVTRLRDALADHPATVEVVLVTEGAARGVAAVEGVRVHAAPGSGDDEIVALVRAAEGRATVVTADRGLRDRVTSLGAQVVGPGTLRSAAWFKSRDGGPDRRRPSGGPE